MEIAVISGKGGTGKSSLTAAFASIIEKVVLVDADVDAANLYLIFNPLHEEEMVYIGGEKANIEYNICANCGACISYCRFDAIKVLNNKVTILEDFCDGCKLCMRVCPMDAIFMVENNKSRFYVGQFKYGKMVYGRLAPGEENSGKMVTLVRDKSHQVAKQTNIKDILIDGPPGIGCPLIASISGVDKVVIVTEPTMSGLHDLKRCIEVVKKFNINPLVIINKFDLNEELTETVNNYCKEIGIIVIGVIPFDNIIVDAMIDCKSVIEYAPESEITKIIKQIFANIYDKQD